MGASEVVLDMRNAKNISNWKLLFLKFKTCSCLGKMWLSNGDFTFSSGNKGCFNCNQDNNHNGKPLWLKLICQLMECLSYWMLDWLRLWEKMMLVVYVVIDA